MSGNDRVWEEIKAFLKALDSYPARFAADPQITFEEHRASLMMLAQSSAQSHRSKVAMKN